MKPGDLVVNDDLTGGYSKIFSECMARYNAGSRTYLGNLTGIGLVLRTHASDALITTNGITGWCYVGNLKVVQ
jgi:hypothetical protein